MVVLVAIGVALFLLLGNSDPTDTATATTSAAPSTSDAPSTAARTSQSAGGASPQTSSQGSPPTGSAGGSGIPPATAEPDGLGDDPVLDQYAQDCYDGDMQACDDLYDDSEVGSRYETYGGTCAGRQPESNLDTVYCTDAFPA